MKLYTFSLIQYDLTWTSCDATIHVTITLYIVWSNQLLKLQTVFRGEGKHYFEFKQISSVFTGLKGTYQGLTATVLKQGSNQAIRFYVMTSLRNWYKGVKHNLLMIIIQELADQTVWLQWSLCSL